VSGCISPLKTTNSTRKLGGTPRYNAAYGDSTIYESLSTQSTILVETKNNVGIILAKTVTAMKSLNRGRFLGAVSLSAWHRRVVNLRPHMKCTIPGKISCLCANIITWDGHYFPTNSQGGCALKRWSQRKNQPFAGSHVQQRKWARDITLVGTRRKRKAMLGCGAGLGCHFPRGTITMRRETSLFT